MNEITLNKMDRLTRLARPFLWDLCPSVYSDGQIESDLEEGKPSTSTEHRRKDAAYIWLKDRGFEVDKRDTYECWVNHICDEYGVEEVFRKLIIPELKRRVGPETMEALRRWWYDCRIPDRKFVKDHNKKHGKNLQKNAGAVLEIHWRFGYVHRFGPLAPVVFEDAAEWLEEEGLLLKSR